MIKKFQMFFYLTVMVCLAGFIGCGGGQSNEERMEPTS
jgi:hypothetical protein